MHNREYELEIKHALEALDQREERLKRSGYESYITSLTALEILNVERQVLLDLQGTGQQ